MNNCGRVQKSPLSSYILCGGASRRYGSDKCQAHLKGLPFYLHILGVLKQIFSSVYSVGKNELDRNIPHILDMYPGQSAMNGIATALNHSFPTPAFIISCDMPLIRPDIVNELLNCHKDQKISCFAASRGRTHYTCGIYSADLLPEMEKALAKKSPALHRLIQKKKYNLVDFGDSSALLNINTSADRDEAESIIGKNNLLL